MAQLVQNTLTSENCETTAYIESDSHDIYLNVNGWLSPDLAQKIIHQIQQCIKK